MIQFGFSQFCTVIMLPLMMPSFAEGIKIQVRYSSREFTVEVNEKDTVPTVKQKIRATNEERHKPKLNGFIELSKCEFDCKYAFLSSTWKTMDEYGIGEGRTIYMKVHRLESKLTTAVICCCCSWF
ncbi:hypothetical protein niasHS_018093 [Heterodera schachtii]|uniref:Ubiquitin-like domain-containing protein n=1 Tax=Heterodera schachtii TaxID=97005 RepID=A0ABD2HZS0_HETSC